jgi:transcriptional regulator with XRE-family HTH domain
MAKKHNIEEQLRQAIESSDMSRYQISKLSEVSEAQLSLFVNGKRGIGLTAAAKIAEVLALELKSKKNKGKK